MADFKQAWKITGANEGGYSNVAGDTGGETYAGITRKNFPHWSGWVTVDSHKPISRGTTLQSLEPAVESFYKTNFWDPVDGDNITDQTLANDVFDMAVNAGVGEALKLLKQS